MSRQKHNVPLGLGPFNYWTLNIAVPMETPETWRSPLDFASHEYCTTIFHYLSGAPTFWQRYAASIRALCSTDDPLGGTPFASLKLSTRLVREIYCSYQSYTNSLFGSELVLTNALLPTFHRLGYSFGKEASMIPPILSDLGTPTCERKRREAVHFFSHAINNLIRYQHGRAPLVLGECHLSCWQTIKHHRLKILLKRGTALHSAE